MRNITLEKIIRFFIGLTTVGVLGLILYNYSTLVAYVILAMILSYILDPFVNRLQRMGMNRTFGITLTLSTVILLLVYISTNVFPLFVGEMIELTENLTIDRIEQIARDVELKLTEEFSFIPPGFLQDNVTQMPPNSLI